MEVAVYSDFWCGLGGLYTFVDDAASVECLEYCAINLPDKDWGDQILTFE